MQMEVIDCVHIHHTYIHTHLAQFVSNSRASLVTHEAEIDKRLEEAILMEGPDLLICVNFGRSVN